MYKYINVNTFDKTKTINVRKTWNSKRVLQKMAPGIHYP